MKGIKLSDYEETAGSAVIEEIMALGSVLGVIPFYILIPRPWGRSGGNTALACSPDAGGRS